MTSGTWTAGEPTDATAETRDVRRSLKRARHYRRKTRNRNRLVAGVVAALLIPAVGIAATRLTRSSAGSGEPAVVAVEAVDLGGMALFLEGDSGNALALGFRACTHERVRIVCHHPNPMLAGVPATDLTLSLTGQNGLRDAEDVREVRYTGVRFGFAGAGAGGLDRLDAALRKAGWERPDQFGRTTYYRPGTAATITLIPATGDQPLTALARPAEPGFVDAQLRLIRNMAVQMRKREREVKALIARMNA